MAHSLVTNLAELKYARKTEEAENRLARRRRFKTPRISGPDVPNVEQIL